MTPRASQTLVMLEPDPAWGMRNGERVTLGAPGYRLAPNEGALVRIGLAFAEACETVDGGIAGLGSIRVRFSMLGMPRTANLTTPETIWLENLGECP